MKPKIKVGDLVEVEEGYISIDDDNRFTVVAAGGTGTAVGMGGWYIARGDWRERLDEVHLFGQKQNWDLLAHESKLTVVSEPA